MTDPSPDRSTYSPELRTAVVLTGTGADGAYHAGVLRGLAEAGVKIDLVAGHGIGAVGAVFAALDGGARLWDASGLWRRAAVSGLYGWRTTLRISGWSLAAAAAVILAPLAVLALGLLVYGAALVLESFGSGTAARVASGYADLVATAFGCSSSCCSPAPLRLRRRSTSDRCQPAAVTGAGSGGQRWQRRWETAVPRPTSAPGYGS